MLTRALDVGLALLIGAAWFPSAATGQSTTLATETPVGVYASEFWGPSSHQSMPAGAPVLATRTLGASVYSTSASLTVESLPLRVRLQESGSARRGPNPFGIPYQAGTAQGSPSGAPHSFLWTLNGAGAGRIVVDLQGTVSELFTVSVHVAVDIGADGTAEVDQRIQPPGTSYQATLPVSFAAGLPVRITVDAGASASSLNHNPDYAFDLQLRYVPAITPATLTPYGTSCGPVLTAADNPLGPWHRLSFTMRGGLPSAYSAFAFGTQRISTPLLGTSCLLLTDPVANVFGATTATGEASFALDLPGPIPRADVQVQAISFDFTPRVLSSGGVEVTIRD